MRFGWGRRLALPGVLLLGAMCACVSRFSTDIPINYHDYLTDKYEGHRAWTRVTMEDEKKSIRIEQDQEVDIVALGLYRTGSVTVVSKAGHKRVVYPMHLPRPLTLEEYEKTLLDLLWMTSPEERFQADKQKYGTRIAEAIRDHKILKDMPQYVAYLSWGAPNDVEQPEGTAIQRWKYDSPNLQGARIDFYDGKVAQFEGENISDTEAAKKRKAVRRGATQTASQ